jgi:hypothetical protein
MKLAWVKSPPAKEFKPLHLKPVTPAQLKKFYSQLRLQYPGKIGIAKVSEAREFNKMLKKLVFGNKKK